MKKIEITDEQYREFKHLGIPFDDVEKNNTYHNIYRFSENISKIDGQEDGAVCSHICDYYKNLFRLFI
jgi:hypothetical protein